MKELTIEDHYRVRGLLSFFMTCLFWLLLGSALTNLVSLVVFNINKELLDSPYFIYLRVNIPFLAMALGIYFTKKYLLEISFKELITNNETYSKPYFFISLLIGFSFLIIYMIIANITGYKSVVFNSVPLKERLIMILLVLSITPFQSALEELLFRALLLKGLVGKYDSSNKMKAIIASIICALVFLLVHLSNPEIQAYKLFAIVYYFTFGFLSAFMTLYFKTVEISIALHVSNNLFVGLISNYASSALKTHSFFNELNNSPHYFDIVVMLLMFATTYFILKTTTYYKATKSGTNLNNKRKNL